MLCTHDQTDWQKPRIGHKLQNIARGSFVSSYRCGPNASVECTYSRNGRVLSGERVLCDKIGALNEAPKLNVSVPQKGKRRDLDYIAASLTVGLGDLRAVRDKPFHLLHQHLPKSFAHWSQMLLDSPWIAIAMSSFRLREFQHF